MSALGRDCFICVHTAEWVVQIGASKVHVRVCDGHLEQTIRWYLAWPLRPFEVVVRRIPNAAEASAQEGQVISDDRR